MIETNDSVAELKSRRIGEQQSLVKNHNEVGRKTQEITRGTAAGEFRVIF
jgi:hypothetical protein